jgi:large conductance mechanosensitive channel
MPLIGALFGGADLSNHFILLSVPAGYAGPMTDYAALKEAGAAMIGYGAFLTALINFVILAFVIFMLVRTANRLIARNEEPPAPAGPSEIDLLAEIRDELRKRS